MSGAETLFLNPATLAALAAVAVGFAALWSNPHRRTNALFFTLSVHVALWLLSVHFSRTTVVGQWWVRMASALGAFVPLHIWVLKEAGLNERQSVGEFCRERWAWVTAATAFAALCFSEYYIPSRSTSEHPIWGPGYYVYTVGLVVLYGALGRETLKQLRQASGGRRLELQVLMLGSCAAGIAVLLLMALRALLGKPWLINVQPVFVFVFYTGTVVAMTTSRIFDARQILLVTLHKFSVVAIVATGAYAMDWVFGQLVAEPISFLITTALALWFSALLNEWLDRLFHFYPQAVAARQAAFSVARRESRAESLEKSFLAILKGWGQTEQALIISGTKEVLRGGGVEVLGDSVVLAAMRQLRWATPERLARERPTSERLAVGEFLHQHHLAVLVIGEGPTLTSLVGVGVAASRRPCTYPQVTQLMEIVSIMESALERAHFAVKVQHTEQLATVGLLGASLAHEIRNPLVTIKTFVQLLPAHYQDQTFRDKFFRLIGDEVNRIDRLTEQLLDLASPRAYLAEDMELHPVLHASVDLVAAKAADKQVEFFTEFQAAPDRVFTDASAAKQVMLNLCFNAIQAAEMSDGKRWVRISTRKVATGVEMVVADSGPGIAPEIRPKLFQPFQTTKSSGFGLGLAICSDILANLHATISVDPPAAGCGATFRVTFPCQPL